MATSGFKEEPSPAVWYGLPLVIGSGLYILHRERIRTRARHPAGRGMTSGERAFVRMDFEGIHCRQCGALTNGPSNHILWT